MCKHVSETSLQHHAPDPSNVGGGSLHGRVRKFAMSGVSVTGCADWVEHVAEFGSYLRTPEASMPWIVRNSLDVIAVWAAAAAALLAVLWGLARALARLLPWAWRRLAAMSASAGAAKKHA